MLAELIKLAWRNVWRNKRRTFITLSSVFLAVLLAVMFRAFQLGSWNQLLDDVIHSNVGYIQIHKKGFSEKGDLENAFSLKKELRLFVGPTDGAIKAIVPRFESLALASGKHKSKISLVTGIKPELEDQFSRLGGKVVKGSYLTSEDSGVLLSESLANFLSLVPGDSLVLFSRNYHKLGITGHFQVKGIVRLPSIEYDNQTVYISLAAAQKFYAASGKITSLAVDLQNPSQVNHAANALKSVFDSANYEIQTWSQLLPALSQQYEVNRAAGRLMLMILYLLVGFSVLSTVLVMVNERKHELGLLLSIGMNKYRLTGILFIELVFIIILGIISGFITSIPIVYFFHIYPVKIQGELSKVMETFAMQPFLPTAWQLDYFLEQLIILSLIVLISIIYPIISVVKLHEKDTFHS